MHVYVRILQTAYVHVYSVYTSTCTTGGRGSMYEYAHMYITLLYVCMYIHTLEKGKKKPQKKINHENKSSLKRSLQCSADTSNFPFPALRPCHSTRSTFLGFCLSLSSSSYISYIHTYRSPRLKQENLTFCHVKCRRRWGSTFSPF